NSLSQVLLKLTSPGVPDLYQGTELWDFSLVDPDNRRPVDYGRRAAMLKKLVDAFAEERDRARAARRLLDQWTDGRVKLWLIVRGRIRWRRRRPTRRRFGSRRVPGGAPGCEITECRYATVAITGA